MIIHYTAQLNVTATEVQAETKDRYNNPTTPASRTVTESANIVVRATTMEALQTKLTAHVALLSGE